MRPNDSNKGSNEISRIDFLIASVLLITAFILRWTNYNELTIWPDEVNIYPPYAYSTLANNWAWSPESMLEPPLFTYILCIITYFFGGSIEIFRIVSIVFGSLSVWVIYFLGKILFGRRIGLLSALLLCFSSFHIMYSKIVMIEATLIFLILTSVYYFIKSYKIENDVRYAALCGIFVGLSSITKWNGILLYPIFIIFVLWTTKNIRALFNKKFKIITLTSLVITLPVWIYPLTQGENPLYYQIFGKFTIAKNTFHVYQQSPGFSSVFINGINKYIHMLIDESSPATSSIPWFSILKIVTSLLLIITILYYMYHALKAKVSETYIFLYFVIFNVFVALYGTRFEYYLLWSVPAFYIMLSGMAIKFYDHIRSNYNFSYLTYIRIIILIFFSIFLISYIYIGSNAPLVNRGELIGYEEQIIKMKNIANPGDAVATSFYRGTEFYINKYNLDIKVHFLYFANEVDLEMLKEVKPRFLIVSSYYFNSLITNQSAKIWIFRYYDLISYYNMESEEDGMLLFEAKQELYNYLDQSNNEITDNVSGTIDHDIFYKSIPALMTVSNPYNVVINIKNTGENTATFWIKLDVPDEFIFSSQKNWKIITLESGSSYRTKFTIVPIKEHYGSLNVKAILSQLNSRHDLPSSTIEMDNASRSVVWIKKAIPI